MMHCVRALLVVALVLACLSMCAVGDAADASKKSSGMWTALADRLQNSFEGKGCWKESAVVITKCEHGGTLCLETMSDVKAGEALLSVSLDCTFAAGRSKNDEDALPDPIVNSLLKVADENQWDEETSDKWFLLYSFHHERIGNSDAYMKTHWDYMSMQSYGSAYLWGKKAIARVKSLPLGDQIIDFMGQLTDVNSRVISYVHQDPDYDPSTMQATLQTMSLPRLLQTHAMIDMYSLPTNMMKRTLVPGIDLVLGRSTSYSSPVLDVRFYDDVVTLVASQDYATGDQVVVQPPVASDTELLFRLGAMVDDNVNNSLTLKYELARYVDAPGAADDDNTVVADWGEPQSLSPFQLQYLLATFGHDPDVKIDDETSSVTVNIRAGQFPLLLVDVVAFSLLNDKEVSSSMAEGRKVWGPKKKKATFLLTRWLKSYMPKMPRQTLEVMLDRTDASDEKAALMYVLDCAALISNVIEVLKNLQDTHEQGPHTANPAAAAARARAHSHNHGHGHAHGHSH
eukprot:GFYU01025713.1.p1 GENE.GFYU01025713.1~~GFYU01025713.1.p1  ORF type:complete len:513 (+),score=99.23 GFYU01025713.1:64-1602(+)